jgi:predicted MFS family arabinose efflux permease
VKYLRIVHLSLVVREFMRERKHGHLREHETLVLLYNAPRLRVNILTLALATLQQVGLTMVRFGLPALAPFIRQDLRLSLVQVGVLMVALEVSSILTYIPLGVLTDRLGERRVLVAGGVIVGGAATLGAIASGYWLLFASLIVAGIGFPSGHIGGGKIVTRYFPPETRGVAVGVRQSGLSLGGFLAAMLIPTISALAGWRFAMSSVGAVCGVFGLLCLLLPRDVERAPAGHSTTGHIRDLVADRDFRVTTLTASLLVVGQFTLQGYLAFFLVDAHEWQPAAAARLLAFVHLGGVCGRLLWGAASDRTAGSRRKPVLSWVIAGGTAVLLVLSVFPAHAGAALAVAVALVGGMFLAGWNGLAITMLLERSGASRAATALGLALSVIYIGTLCGTPLFAWIVERTGSYAPAWLMVTVCNAAAWGLLRLVRETARSA